MPKTTGIDARIIIKSLRVSVKENQEILNFCRENNITQQELFKMGYEKIIEGGTKCIKK